MRPFSSQDGRDLPAAVALDRVQRVPAALLARRVALRGGRQPGGHGRAGRADTVAAPPRPGNDRVTENNNNNFVSQRENS